jgi:hypothetical protein
VIQSLFEIAIKNDMQTAGTPGKPRRIKGAELQRYRASIDDR